MAVKCNAERQASKFENLCILLETHWTPALVPKMEMLSLPLCTLQCSLLGKKSELEGQEFFKLAQSGAVTINTARCTEQ